MGNVKSRLNILKNFSIRTEFWVHLGGLSGNTSRHDTTQHDNYESVAFDCFVDVLITGASCVHLLGMN